MRSSYVLRRAPAPETVDPLAHIGQEPKFATEPFISRLTEQAEDGLKQGEKLETQSQLSEIEQDQLEAYERFLADTTGVTDLMRTAVQKSATVAAG